MTKVVKATANDARTATCRNADCGKEFDTSDVVDQNGQPVLCPTCWDEAKEGLKVITSAKGSGSKGPKKRKEG